MVCSKCQKKLKTTELATPGVKRKSEMYHGSPATSTAADSSKSAKPTLGSTGIGKVSFSFITCLYLFIYICLL